MIERRIYQKPPIAEAVCEIRYSSEDWDPTIPGRMQERLSGRYDGKPQEQRLLQADMRHVDAPDGPGVEIQGLQQNRIQLRDLSEKRILSIAENAISVSDLEPYSGWEAFYGRIEEAIRMYHELVPSLNVTRIGIRYINRISVSEDPVNLSDYFRVSPQLPDGLNVKMYAFQSRSESRYEDGPGLTVTFASSEGAFILDLDAWLDSEENMSLEQILDTICDLRDRERFAFERSITDQARDLFDKNE